MGTEKRRSEGNCNDYVFLIKSKMNNARMKGDLSRKVILLPNELNIMPYKHLMAAAWEGINEALRPNPRTSAHPPLLTMATHCLPVPLRAL